MKTYEPVAGDTIRNTCKRMAEMAAFWNAPVQAEFNGVTITARPDLTAGDLEQGWRAETDRRHAEYVASPEYKQRKAEGERLREEKNKALQEALSVAGPMEFANEAMWKEFTEKNTDAYGSGVVRYAEKWARLMQTRIANSESIEQHAGELRHLADNEGITGFMYGCAVSILAQTWKHGEALRRWHNKETQLGDEGDKANESGGVLNPALLVVSSNK